MALTNLIAMPRWHPATDSLKKELLAHSRRPEGVVAFAAFASLPALVQRYLRSVLRDGQPLIATARVRIAQARANAEHLQRYQQLADHAAASQRHAAEEVARLSERVGAIEKLLRDVGER